MPDTFISLAEVEWVEQLVCDRYKVKIPKFLADAHKWWPDWEVARTRSMEGNLKKGDILFDVGTEIGWQSAIYAQFVGPENMVLIEPTPELWPHIWATWQENSYSIPLATVCAFLSDTDASKTRMTYGEAPLRNWPIAAQGGFLLQNTKFTHLDEDGERLPRITLDRYVKITEIVPRALTIDVEGWELAVLKGARKTLLEHRPLVWVSLHEGFVNRPGIDPKNTDVDAFMESLGYKGEKLGVDHEIHMLYRPQ